MGGAVGMFEHLILLVPRQGRSTAWGHDGRTAMLEINHSLGAAAFGKCGRKLGKVRLRVDGWV